jgi:hypothetical protein
LTATFYCFFKHKLPCHLPVLLTSPGTKVGKMCPKASLHWALWQLTPWLWKDKQSGKMPAPQQETEHLTLPRLCCTLLRIGRVGYLPPSLLEIFKLSQCICKECRICNCTQDKLLQPPKAHMGVKVSHSLHRPNQPFSSSFYQLLGYESPIDLQSGC